MFTLKGGPMFTKRVASSNKSSEVHKSPGKRRQSKNLFPSTSCERLCRHPVFGSFFSQYLGPFSSTMYCTVCTSYHLITQKHAQHISTSWHITTHTKCGKMMKHVSQQPSFGSSILCSACNPRANLRWGKFAADDPVALSHLWPPQGWDGTFQERMQLRADGSLYYFVLSSGKIMENQTSTVIIYNILQSKNPVECCRML